MLTKSQKSAFKVLKYGFGYLYPTPFDWDLELSQAKLSPFELNRTWVPFLFMMSLNQIVAIACFYVPLSHYLVRSRTNYNLLLAAMHFMSGLFMSGVSVVGFFLYSEWSAFDKLLNEIISIKIQILEELGCPQKEFRVDRLLVPAAIGTCIGAILITVCAPFLEIDAFCFVFQDVLPDSKFRKRITILLVYIVRTCLIAGVLESGRTLTTMGISIIVLCTNGLNCLIALLSNRMNFRSTSIYYESLLIIGKILDPGIGMAIQVGTSVLDMVARVSSASKRALERCLSSARLHFAAQGGLGSRKEALYLKLRVESLKIYRPPYGSFMKMDRQFFCNFFYQLADKIFSALLIF
ncbi:unnamed protein product [Orchesella dallaii]|uniref:Odorant receptor n=1 Tax=Orchesella dallaii TaxID=48710 RepID=A0ABP1RP69_9HEXA